VKNASPPGKILVLDVGGSNVKFRVTGQTERSSIPSGPDYTPERLLTDLAAATSGWDYDAVTVGFPAPVIGGRLPFEPQNLGTGWVDFRFDKALGKPVKLINDAAMQAVGAYTGGRTLFLSLGTGLGAALIDDYHVMGLELCHLRWSGRESLEDRLGKPGRARIGRKSWEKSVHTTVAMMRASFLPDTIVLGGGRAKKLTLPPEGIVLGDNSLALDGGERLWSEQRFRISGALPPAEQTD